ncbi:MAG TPA: CDP-alcohol phosphatidyltransferase family protein [Terriglobales bacterium]
MKSQFWNAPNQITLLRLIFVPFMIINVLDRSYGWALAILIVSGVSDGLDGLLARVLHQRTKVGEYLDPIADKLMLSSLFLSLSFTHQIPWRYTVLVFSRDIGILAVSLVLYMTTPLRDFRPSIFGKVNTVCQIGAVFFVLLSHVVQEPWIMVIRRSLLQGVFVFTLVSALHYIYLTGIRLHEASMHQPNAHH